MQAPSNAKSSKNKRLI